MNYNTLSGSAKFYKKAGLLATGQMVTEGEMPNIAIITTLTPFENKRLVNSVGYGVRHSGGAVGVYYTQMFGSSNRLNPMTAKFATSFTDTTARNTEAIIKTNMIDGVVAVTDCPITAMGIIQGCSRVNCPVLVVPVGVSCVDTEPLRLLGKITNAKQLDAIMNTVNLPNGIPNNLNTVSTFFLLAESMGLAVPSAGTGTANSGEHFRTAVITGEQIVKNAKDVLFPKKFLTKSHFANTTALCLSINGNISALKMWESLSQQKIEFPTTPLFNVEIKDIQVLPMLKQLSQTPKLIDGMALMYNGEKLKNYENISEFETIKRQSVIPCKGFISGYAQPQQNTPPSFSGRAWVYDGIEAADKALLSGGVPANSVIVVQNCVDMDISALVNIIEGANRTQEIAVITDGYAEKSDTLIVTHCTPSTHENEDFANIQTGDIIEIDLSKGRLNTNVSAKDFKTRAKKNSVKKLNFYF